MPVVLAHNSFVSQLIVTQLSLWHLVAFVFFFHYVFGAYTCIVIGLIPKLV